MSEGPTVRPVAPQESDYVNSTDFRSAGLADQAAQYLEGEEYALAFIERLHTDTASPDDLAVVAGFLRGAMLRGFCRVIQKSLGVRHG